MAINLRSTIGIKTDGIKMLVHGMAGTGKTTLIKTLPNPVILSAEGGLLSLADCEIPFIEIKTLQDLGEAYMWCKDSKESNKFDSVCLDSISEVAEVILAHEMKPKKVGDKVDGRAAYGSLNTIMQEMIRKFRDLSGKNVYFTAKTEKSPDQDGKILYGPMMPGKSLTQNLPYFFDLVMALRVQTDSEGDVHRGLMCHSDGMWTAKDRSGKLGVWEKPDLGAIITKITGDSK